MVRAPEPESFGNRKLIRPTLNREQVRVRSLLPSVVNEQFALRNAPRAYPSRNLRHQSRPTPENFYYQKQMQSKTPMVVVTRDGEALHGIIEWYDKHCIKLNRAGSDSNLLIYKSSIRYMFKEAEETK